MAKLAKYGEIAAVVLVVLYVVNRTPVGAPVKSLVG